MVAAGLTQGAFYRHFQSKEQLIAEASAAAFELLLDSFDNLAFGKPPREAIDLIIHAYLCQHQDAKSVVLCPIANLSSELRNANEQIKGVITEGYSRLVNMLAIYLTRLNYDDSMNKAEAIVALIVGSVSLSQLTTEAKLSIAILNNAQNAANLILRDISSSEP